MEDLEVFHGGAGPFLATGWWGVPGLGYLKEKSQEEQGSCQMHGQLGKSQKDKGLGMSKKVPEVFYIN